VAALLALSRQAERRTAIWMITGRTHNVPAQPTTLGKRLAMFGQELLISLERLENLIERYPGARREGGGRDAARPADVAWRPRRSRGRARRPYPAAPRIPGFVWGRSGRCIRAVLILTWCRPCTNWVRRRPVFAHTLRLMAGQGLLTEGFRDGQVGSSVMPHK